MIIKSVCYYLLLFLLNFDWIVFNSSYGMEEQVPKKKRKAEAISTSVAKKSTSIAIVEYLKNSTDDNQQKISYGSLDLKETEPLNNKPWHELIKDYHIKGLSFLIVLLETPEDEARIIQRFYPALSFMQNVIINRTRNLMEKELQEKSLHEDWAHEAFRAAAIQDINAKYSGHGQIIPSIAMNFHPWRNNHMYKDMYNNKPALSSPRLFMLLPGQKEFVYCGSLSEITNNNLLVKSFIFSNIKDFSFGLLPSLHDIELSTLLQHREIAARNFIQKNIFHTLTQSGQTIPLMSFIKIYQHLLLDIQQLKNDITTMTNFDKKMACKRYIRMLFLLFSVSERTYQTTPCADIYRIVSEQLEWKEVFEATLHEMLLNNTLDMKTNLIKHVQKIVALTPSYQERFALVIDKELTQNVIDHLPKSHEYFMIPARIALHLKDKDFEKAQALINSLAAHYERNFWQARLYHVQDQNAAAIEHYQLCLKEALEKLSDPLIFTTFAAWYYLKKLQKS